MVTTLLLISAMISGGYLDSANECFALEKMDRSTIYLSGDTTGFSDYASISIGNVYATAFSSTSDMDYYAFFPSSSGIYTFSVLDGKNVSVVVYGASSPTVYSQIGAYTVNSNESNFGYNHGFFLDTSVYSYFYFSAKSSTYVSNQAYFCAIDLLPEHESSLDVFRYDVETRSYTSLSFSSSGSGASSTLGYNPTGSTSLNLPNAIPGNDVVLSVANGYNTTNTYPYKAVAGIGSGHGGTAFLVGPNVVATAAHCVSDREHVYPSIQFDQLLFGDNGGGSSVETGTYKHVYVSPSWFRVDDQNDWAFCILNEDCGLTNGYLPIQKYSSWTALFSNPLVIDGYKNCGLNQTLSYGLYVGQNGEKIEYTCQTAVGQSGSPVYSNSYGGVYAINTGLLGSGNAEGVVFSSYRFALAELLISGVVL